MVAMIPTLLNGKWQLTLPAHRADRAEWTTPPYWERERLDSMCANIRPGDVVFDIGSEEGDISALCSQWAQPGGGVVLFEPNNAVWPNPRCIFEANDLPTPLAVYSGFAGTKNSRHHLEGLHRNTWPPSSDGPVIGNHGFCRVEERPDLPQIRLDTFCSETSIYPNVITMDVEGAEEYVCRGATSILRSHKPLVYISVHPSFIQAHYSRSHLDLYNFMDSLGYQRHHIATDHEEHWVFWRPDSRVPIEFS